jgi:hypothetical protein
MCFIGGDMSAIDFEQFLEKLSSISERDYIDPASFQWPATTDHDAWYFTPELISIYGSDTWRSMSVAQQKELSFFEAVNFFSLNIHGEKYLISEISRRLFDSDNSKLSSYLLHFVDEESRHMMYFSGFCQRYAGEIYPDRTIHSNASDDAEYDLFMLFARINVFEEIVDYYNKTMASDERLAPVVREINRIHHVEEVRHLAFGRKFLKQCLDKNISASGNKRRSELRSSLMEYLNCVWKEYYNPRAYKDAGLPDAFRLWQVTANSLAATQHRTTVNRERLKFLSKMNLLEVI